MAPPVPNHWLPGMVCMFSLQAATAKLASSDLGLILATTWCGPAPIPAWQALRTTCKGLAKQQVDSETAIIKRTHYSQI
jgi:hypothetical protein